MKNVDEALQIFNSIAESAQFGKPTKEQMLNLARGTMLEAFGESAQLRDFFNRFAATHSLRESQRRQGVGKDFIASRTKCGLDIGCALSEFLPVHQMRGSEILRTRRGLLFLVSRFLPDIAVLEPRSQEV